MLGRLRMSVDDCIKAYKDLDGDIFRNPRTFSIRGPALWPKGKYDHRGLERAIRQVVQKHDPPDLTPHNARPELASDPDKCKTYVSSKYFRV